MKEKGAEPLAKWSVAQRCDAAGHSSGVTVTAVAHETAASQMQAVSPQPQNEHGMPARRTRVSLCRLVNISESFGWVIAASVAQRTGTGPFDPHCRFRPGDVNRAGRHRQAGSVWLRFLAR